MTDHLPVPGPAAEPVGTAGSATGAVEAHSAASTDSAIPAGKYDADLDRLFGAGGPLAPAVGRYCRLEPLSAERHAADLYQAFSQAPDDSDWTYMGVGPFARWKEASVPEMATPRSNNLSSPSSPR